MHSVRRFISQTIRFIAVVLSRDWRTQTYSVMIATQHDNDLRRGLTMTRHRFRNSAFRSRVITVFMVGAAMTFGAVSHATLPRDVKKRMVDTAATWPECNRSRVGTSHDKLLFTDDANCSVLPQASDITPARSQDKDFECMSVCRNICWLIWQSATAYCEKSIPPKKRKERERCFRRANEDYAECLRDCERENGRCN